MTDRDSAKRDEDRVRIPLDPEEALQALLRVDPESEPKEQPGADRTRSADDDLEVEDR